MNKKGLITTVALSILAVLFLATCLCYAEQGKDEKEFVAIVAEINSIFSKADELSQNVSSSADYEKADQQLDPMGNALMTRLRQFIIDYPASVYVDDAAYNLTWFWIGDNEKYIQELKLFLEKYPEAFLESFTINNLQNLNPFAKEVGVINAVKIDICINLSNLKRFEESAKEARVVIDDLNRMVLSDRGYGVLAFSYIYLMKDYEALNKNEQVRSVCNEAIEKLPNAKSKEIFVKKLKELDTFLK